MSALARGDLDRGYLLMHQALEENRRATGSAIPNTPARAFVSLDHAKVDPAFRGWLLDQAGLLDSLLQSYRATHSRLLDLDGFARRFLGARAATEATFLFAYALARLVRLSRLPRFALSGGFASQLELGLIFDVVLVLDAALALKNPSPSVGFKSHAVFLSGTAKLSLTDDELGEANGRFKCAFDTTLADALRTSFAPKGRALSPLERSIVVSYGLRNRGAHSVASVPALWERFEDVKQCVFDSLFLAVETLY